MGFHRRNTFYEDMTKGGAITLPFICEENIGL